MADGRNILFLVMSEAELAGSILKCHNASSFATNLGFHSHNTDSTGNWVVAGIIRGIKGFADRRKPILQTWLGGGWWHTKIIQIAFAWQLNKLEVGHPSATVEWWGYKQVGYQMSLTRIRKHIMRKHSNNL